MSDILNTSSYDTELIDNECILKSQQELIYKIDPTIKIVDCV
jgi:hypothetical protein